MQKIVFLASCVFPHGLNDKSVVNNSSFASLLRQLELLALSWIRYYRKSSSLFLFTNSVSTIISYLKEQPQGLAILNHINFLESNELPHCKNHQGAHFSYAFSKIDALHYFYHSSHYTNNDLLILTDLDACLLSPSSLHHFLLNRGTSRSCAIDYFREHSVNERDFADVITTIYPDAPSAQIIKAFLSQNGWINSGFIFIESLFLSKVIINSQKIVDNLRSHKTSVEESINHYGDELVFSAIAFDCDFIRLSNFHQESIAMLLWTCPVPQSPLLVNILKPPFHLHLPALKWQPKLHSSLLLILHFFPPFSPTLSSTVIILWINCYNLFWSRGLGLLAKKIYFCFRKLIVSSH